MDAASPFIRTAAMETAPSRRSTYQPWSVADAAALASRRGIPIGDVLLIAVSACGLRSVYDRDRARVALRLRRPATHPIQGAEKISSESNNKRRANATAHF
jgi:hypothetical protein